MIPQELIDKLGLVKTGISHFGMAFVSNCEIFDWPKYGFQIMDCDFDGNPLENGMFKIFCIRKIEDKKVYASCNAPFDVLMSLSEFPEFAKQCIERIFKKVSPLC